MKEKEDVVKKSSQRKNRSSKSSDSPPISSQLKIEEWFVYILECKDGSFYTGITKDLNRRLKMHNAGKAASYTRSRRPVSLLYQQKCLGRTEALIRECAIKALPREKKEELVFL